MSRENVELIRGLYEAVARGDSVTPFEAYDEKVRKSVIGSDLYRSRNMRQPFAQGFLVGRPVAEREMTALLLAHSGLAKELD